MADSVVIGVVQSVSSLTAGVVKDSSGTSYNYSDATLTTRGVELALGEYVSGTYDGATMANVCSLTDIYEQGLEDANEVNALTAASVKTKLQIATGCASKQGQKAIDQKAKGQDGCEALVQDSVLMTNLANSICGIVPEGESIGGNQATQQIVVSAVGNPALVMGVNLTIGSVTYVMSIGTSPARTTTNVAQYIADFVNALYPDSYSYYAEASGASVILSGSGFDADNGDAVSLIVTNGTILNYSPSALAGGTEEVLQGENNITNEDIQVVLDKLNKLCKIPCDKIFQN